MSRVIFMPNWLTKASGGLPRESDDVPQMFQLTCECAEQHTGQRKTRPQRIICQTCGTALFVLPKNAYPPLKSAGPPKRKKKKKSRKRRADGPPAGGLPSGKELMNSLQGGFISVASGAGRLLTAGTSRLRDGGVAIATAIAKTAREFFTPFRLVLASMAIILLATALTALRSRSLENARETFRTEVAAGESALANEDLPGAREHLAAAVAAIETLGNDDPQSLMVRQRHREVTAITRLSPESLFGILDEAEKSTGQIGAVSWNDIFRTRYQNSWLVLQAPIRRDQSDFVLDVPLTVGRQNRPVRIVANLRDFDQLPSTDGMASVIFAAPIIGCERGANDEWNVTLDPVRGFLWTNLDNLRRLGFFEAEWADESEVAALLKTQSAMIGVQP